MAAIEKHLNTLSALVNKTSVDNPVAKQIIYDVITQKVAPNVDANQCPPPFLLIYAIRNIVYPVLLVDCIPDLLNLLAQLDYTRREAVRQAQEALALHKSLVREAKANNRRVNVLTLSEIKALNFSKSVNEIEHRSLYRSISLSFGYFHISNYWTSELSWKIPLLFRTYFQVKSDASAPGAEKRLFMYNLSSEEQEDIRRMKEACIGFMKDANAWDAERTAMWKAKGIPLKYIYSDEEPFSYTRDFQAKFSSLMPEEKILIETLEVYLKKVEQIFASMGEIFAPTNKSAS